MYNGTIWSSDANLNVPRMYPGLFGTQLASVLSTGYNTSTGVIYDTTEEYNGVSWTVVNQTNSIKWGVGTCGIQMSALLS